MLARNTRLELISRLILARRWPIHRGTRLVLVAFTFSLVLAAPKALRADDVGDPVATTELRVMSFNLWHGGDAGGQPLEQTQAVIQAANADIVGLQETAGKEQDGVRPDRAQSLASRLNWHYADQGDHTGVLTRYPIVEVTPKKTGVRIQLPNGESVWVFNTHLAHAPYQPYQLLKIPYADAPFLDGPEQAVAAALQSRGAQIQLLLDEVRSAVTAEQPCFVTGDFNEPSHLDWTPAAAHARRCPCVVKWPTTAAVTAAGFLDAYRERHPDPFASPGYTWTSTTREDDPADHHDRIDFVFVRGQRVRVTRSQVIGERVERADIIIKPYPSDHRAVVVDVEWPRASTGHGQTPSE